MSEHGINPVKFAYQVNQQFINYQLTAFPLSDNDLADQARDMLKAKIGSPLIKGPYVSLSRSFRLGRNLNDIARAGLVHAALPGLTEHPGLFAHQDKTLDEVMQGNHCLITTGTGSGKTEAFLYPILNYCLELRDAGKPDGLVAILVYPMNALAYDQLGRLRKMLAGSQISFGMYTGTTPANDGAVSGDVVRMKEGEGQADFAGYERKYRGHAGVVISPSEERLTEAEMAARPPRILLTNVNQLEYLITRGKDLGMFIDAPLRFLVFDEAHTYRGAVGAEVACLIRRIKAFCGKTSDDVICMGTSATITDPEYGAEAGKRFAQRFFGINPDKVKLVEEEYERENFPLDRYTPDIPTDDTIAILDMILEAVDKRDGVLVSEGLKKLTGKDIGLSENWSEELYDHLKQNEIIRTLFDKLPKPVELDEAVQVVNNNIGRGAIQISDQLTGELLCYLVLGAAAEKKANPLIRPKLHYFLRGLEGAVVTFGNTDGSDPEHAMLSMSLSDAMEKYGVDEKACPPIYVCRTCGQHYYEGYYRNFELDSGEPSGGDAEEDNVIWEAVDEPTGNRVVFTNRFVAPELDEGDNGNAFDDQRIYFCRWCGTLHKNEGSCVNPKCKRKGRSVPVYFIPLRNGRHLSSCISCKQRGRVYAGRFIEPIKPLRAITVADVHILAQNMLNAVSGPHRKLIVFSDNRQDAAFQAGWMQDHARRYRLRHLVYEYVKGQDEPSSLSDIVEHLLNLFKADHDLAKMLAPEVYLGRAREAYGRTLDNELKKFTRYAMMLEFGSNFKKIDCLESWGIVKVVYKDVDKDNAWIREWAETLKLTPEDLANGICALLDVYRRTRLFHDEQAPIFSRYWREGDEEIQRGYLPFFTNTAGKALGPVGIKYNREIDDNRTWLREFAGRSGRTLTQDYVKKWPVDENQREGFLEALWGFLADTAGVLQSVELKGNRGNVLPGTAGSYQVSAQKMAISPDAKRYRCSLCKRIHTRYTPSGVCTAYRCSGTLIEEPLPDDNYDIQMLKLPFSMVAAHEHSAQVPAKIREQLEEQFKKTDGRYNCLVCTPTLELGVDIGDLDMVLMRNVPPTSANFWQRAGRAGRRFRMAVNYTYCRRSQHDEYFFDDPLQMLSGEIPAPRFNLRNDVMLAKHIHSAVLSEVIRLSKLSPESSGLSKDEIEDLKYVIMMVFPNFTVDYLFDELLNYRMEPPDVSVLQNVISKYREHFDRVIQSIFTQWWPDDDSKYVSADRINSMVNTIAEKLQATVGRLFKRMLWAKDLQEKLTSKQNKGILEQDDDRVLNRCKRYLKKMSKNSIETYTLNVLAQEGFLPGYEVLDGTIRSYASRALSEIEGRPDFELSRPATIAVREFVPGNAIYANSGKFRIAYYHLPIGEQRTEPTRLMINPEKGFIIDYESYGRSGIRYNDSELISINAIEICDNEITHMGKINDEELNRFQLPVVTHGYLKERHRGGEIYSVYNMNIQIRFGQEIRIVNIGPADKVRAGELGFPICSVCGAARSPYVSDSEREHFNQIHDEKCKKGPENIAFFTDAIVDGLVVDEFQEYENAVNFAETIKIGTAKILDVEQDDLQYMIWPREDEGYKLFLYDPMSGGSGLILQIIEYWDKVCSEALIVLDSCECDKACYNCMKTYRNLYTHIHLDRHTAHNIIGQWSQKPEHQTSIPALLHESSDKKGNMTGTNIHEIKLEEMLDDYGFPKFTSQKDIALSIPPIKNTQPDLYYESDEGNIKIAIYLDGLSKSIHDNEERRQIDMLIRSQLEAKGIDVIEIAVSDLADPQARNLQLQRIAGKLRRQDLISKLDKM